MVALTVYFCPKTTRYGVIPRRRASSQGAYDTKGVKRRQTSVAAHLSTDEDVSISRPLRPKYALRAAHWLDRRNIKSLVHAKSAHC